MDDASESDCKRLPVALRDELIERVFRAVEGWRGGEGAVLDALDAKELRAELPEIGGARGLSLLPDWLDSIVAHSQRIHHPRYLGHQVAAPIDLAAVMELVNALLNNGMAIYEMGPIQTIAEERTVSWMARKIGFGPEAGGHFTSGGTLGNLTALLAARRWAYEGTVWRDGQSGASLPCVLVSDQAHYSVDRAVRVMGWGEAGAWKVASDEGGAMSLEGLRASVGAARAAGRRPIAVVGNACSTALGVFDPLDGIADFCRENKLWMHVDGAHGASFLLCEAGRGLMRGIERADSVVWDAHKMLRMPALMTGLIFRERRRAGIAFEQRADYIFDDEAHKPDVGTRSFECTKRGMALTLYSCLLAYGEEPFAAHLRSLLDTTRVFARAIEADEDFELAQFPALNILCFRPRDPSVDGPRLREALVQGGTHYLVGTSLDGEYWLRMTVVEGGEAEARIRGLLAECRRTIREMKSSSESNSR